MLEKNDKTKNTWKKKIKGTYKRMLGFVQDLKDDLKGQFLLILLSFKGRYEKN